mgnify:CR=1 FL=1
MYSVNENYLKLPGSYLFSNIAKKVAAFSAANPDAPIIRLGRMISRQEDAILQQMRSLSQTERRVILEISRRFLDLTAESQ